MNYLRQLLSKISLSGLLVLLAAIFSYRAGSNKQDLANAKEEANEFKEIIKDVEQARRINDDVDALSDDAVARELHANDWYRD